MSPYLRSLVFQSHDFIAVKSGWWLVVSGGTGYFPCRLRGSASSASAWQCLPLTRWLEYKVAFSRLRDCRSVDGLLLALSSLSQRLESGEWPIKSGEQYHYRSRKGIIKDVENIAQNSSNQNST